MKKLFLMLAAVMAIAIPKAAQAVDVEGVYVGGLAGVNWLQFHKHKVKVHFKTGWLAGGFIGYRWCGGLRLEAEGTYRYNRTKSVRVRFHDHSKSHRIGGHLRTWSLMANGYYEIPLCWCVTPYIGAGVGYDWTRVQACHRRTGRHKDSFAWQVIAGGLYDIDDCMEVGIEYRFHAATRERRLYNHALVLRLNWFVF
jgi:opacity protein-like surface antigen